MVTLKGLLEAGPGRSGLHVDEEGGVVDGDDTVEPGDVERHPTEDRHASAAHPAPAHDRRDRDAFLVAQLEHVGHLLGVGRAGDGGRQGGRDPVDRPDDRQWPPVPAGVDPRLIAGVDHGTHAFQPAQERGGDLDLPAEAGRPRGRLRG